MLNKLWLKLTIAFLLVAIIGVVVVAVLANRATSASFNRFLEEENSAGVALLLDELADHYRERGSWAGVEALLRQYRSGMGSGIGLILIDGDGQTVAVAGSGRGNRPRATDQAEGFAVQVGGQVVGQLVVEGPPGQAMAGRAGQQFLSDVNEAILLAGVIAVTLALILGVLLARGLTRPLGKLTEATRSVAAGDLDQQVPVSSGDELGELAGSFNLMAAALAANERQRQQLFADIAHELRTPLSVIRGQLEAMLDGVLELSPENLSLAHEETILLGRLVDELRALSLAESGQLPLDKKPLDLGLVVTGVKAAFDPLAEAEGIGLGLIVEPDLPRVPADEARVQQVLGNLLSNALRHAGQGDDLEPEVRLEVVAKPRAVQVSVSDNGPGLSPEAQSHVFDRFWRADAGRSRDRGGSGLGLAISRGIIIAHGGQIWVESAPGRGATFAFELPIAGR
ncbi:MAG: HAMP domain-containing protein [Chloroflexota bacterium]|nr:MAG: HAMP domain-containing protein [Chloroflexota bacterium]